MSSPKLLDFFCVFIYLLHLSLGQYAQAPPGVNPQLYQQQQVPQHIPSAQNIPHQQEVPYQQHPQAQQQHQSSYGTQDQTRQPHTPHHQQQVLHASNMAEESEHIKKHMEMPLDTSKMSEQELQFHYFKMHDADNNNKLDGCELIKSLIHWHVQGGNDPARGSAPPPEDKVFTDEELMQLIDPILTMDDANFDGFIDYPEFVIAQNKAANSHKKPA
ncbi:uncharacterized protein LOC126846855 [Adelges cooleyi]|uniref:uncharacterized protein LOC126846855 n=1 Tax=Adelges cooleyi TaxID=133065 RepID=UPI00217F3FDD|nr:uncharacterized protein LOC126846855 [Adelges cooleyi]XP_050442632.1 uncharacterized protein LOC126846855 [Adelges cooleyi]